MDLHDLLTRITLSFTFLSSRNQSKILWLRATDKKKTRVKIVNKSIEDKIYVKIERSLSLKMCLLDTELTGGPQGKVLIVTFVTVRPTST
jgi:hypothetical protein